MHISLLSHHPLCAERSFRRTGSFLESPFGAWIFHIFHMVWRSPNSEKKWICDVKMPSSKAVNKDQVAYTIFIVVVVILFRHPANWQTQKLLFSMKHAHRAHSGVETKKGLFRWKKQNSWLKFRVFAKCFEHFPCPAFFRQPCASSLFLYFGIEPNEKWIAEGTFSMCVCVAIQTQTNRVRPMEYFLLFRSLVVCDQSTSGAHQEPKIK